MAAKTVMQEAAMARCLTVLPVDSADQGRDAIDALTDQTPCTYAQIYDLLATGLMTLSDDGQLVLNGFDFDQTKHYFNCGGKAYDIILMKKIMSKLTTPPHE